MTRPKCPECSEGRLKGFSDATVRNHDMLNWFSATLLGSPQKITDLYEHCDVCGWGRVFTRRERRKRPAPASPAGCTLSEVPIHSVRHSLAGVFSDSLKCG